MEVAEASRCHNNKRVEEARRARVLWLESLRRDCGSEEEFETARSQPTWTELDSTSYSSSCASDGPSSADLERVRHENRLQCCQGENCLLYKNLFGGPLLEKDCMVADFDSPEGVIGTRFWRAPEILLALKNGVRDLSSHPRVWTEKVDVYSYAMTCYEILTGCIPFEGRARDDYDGVICGERPPLPDYVDHELGELVKMCWHSKPSMRPTFEEILLKLWRINREYEY